MWFTEGLGLEPRTQKMIVSRRRQRVEGCAHDRGDSRVEDSSQITVVQPTGEYGRYDAIIFRRGSVRRHDNRIKQQQVDIGIGRVGYPQAKEHCRQGEGQAVSGSQLTRVGWDRSSGPRRSGDHIEVEIAVIVAVDWDTGPSISLAEDQS